MKKLPLLFLLLAVVAFGFGLTHLFRLRFEAGDIYPEYSSLRADPLGTKAFYQSLNGLLTARRNYQAWPELEDGRDTTLLFLGAAPESLEFTEAEFKQIERFVGSGGRLVIALLPRYVKPPTNLAQRAVAPAGTTPGRKAGRKPPEELAHIRPIPVTEQWGLAFNVAELPRDERQVFKPARATRRMAGSLPPSIDCHTALFFDKLDSPWRVIYARASDRAVVIERDFGLGTVALAADSYYFSNEALRRARQPELLAWMLGPNRKAVFDEVHLGVSENPGIGALARRYRLHGLLVALAVLAGLFVWKSAVRFVPPYDEDARRDSQEVVLGRESAAGFINLLRRNIPADNLLGTCLLEWKKSCAHQTPKARLEQVQALIDAENAREPRARNVLRAYQAISRVLSVKRKA
jgi:hypothetical protein